MGSELHIVTVGGDRDLGASAHVMLAELEEHWSRFLTTSDITHINLAAGEPVRVADSTLTLVATMQAAHTLTDGAYDPTILPVLVANGYGASRLDATQRTPMPTMASTGDVADVRVDTFERTITAPAGLTLDAGGIGKGLAADLAVSWLLDNGATGALVSIGGDMSMAGVSPFDDGWSVAVEHDDGNERPLCTLAVSGGGVATSSTRTRRWMTDDGERHHAIDPRTRSESSTDLAAVTVVAGSGWAAEAHATAALLCGSAGVAAYLAGHALMGIATTLDGRLVTTDGLSWIATEAGAPR